MQSTEPALHQETGKQYLPLPSDFKEERSPNQELLPLTTKVNSKDRLEVGGCEVEALVKQYGTPLYILDEETLRSACRQYKSSMQKYYKGESLVLYASKAWSCLSVCAIANSEGLGIDVVSGGELHTAILAGVKGEKLYLHGNNKSVSELNLAIANSVTIVVDNIYELETIAKIADPKSPVRIMLRLTPGIECHTHEYIRTGHLDSKFGFDPNSLEEVFMLCRQHKQINCIGLHAHIGSQIFETQPHKDLPSVLVKSLMQATEHGLAIKEINVGGGLGIRYTESDDPPSISHWVRCVCEAMTDACRENGIPLPKLLCEPGRSLIGTACVTAYTIGSSKTVPGIRTYIAIDGGMSDNPRPITYQSEYQSIVANRMSELNTETVTIAGKHCESGDILIKKAILPKTQPGDILVVMGTGAYNYSMASNYNRLPRPAAVLVNQGESNIILERESYQDLLRSDRLPERLLQSEEQGLARP